MRLKSDIVTFISIFASKYTRPMRKLRIFISGIESLTNIDGRYTARRKIKSDAENLASDWYNVGNDICKSMQRYEYR